MARAKELEAKEREDSRLVDPNRATAIEDEEEGIGLDEDDDNVDFVIDDSGSENSGRRKSGADDVLLDEFTDNESDIFRDGDGTKGETYGLHTHVRHSGSQGK